MNSSTIEMCIFSNTIVSANVLQSWCFHYTKCNMSMPLDSYKQKKEKKTPNVISNTLFHLRYDQPAHLFSIALVLLWSKAFTFLYIVYYIFLKRCCKGVGPSTFWQEFRPCVAGWGTLHRQWAHSGAVSKECMGGSQLSALWGCRRVLPPSHR